ncbi:MAG: hypothetical protein K6F58_03205 [Bacteroidales bacterium]|nr:hypothetical protein [Bacteroidales bacterium]
MLKRMLAIIICFWNVENFFAPGEFEGHAWSKTRFYTKCNAVAKTLLLSADEFGDLPDVVGFAEVGDASVLKALLYSTPLRKLDYSFVHYDSPDRRGIDCALLYRRSRFRLLNSKPCHLCDSAGAILPTRDILLAVLVGREGGDTLAVLVNHHPSKVGSGSEDRRRIAMERLRFLADSLKSAGISQIIAVGDFNDEVLPAKGVNSGGQVQSETAPPPGTIKFQGKWEKIDGCPLLEGLAADEHIFAPQQLLTRDSYGGEKPRRTFSGPRYLGGVSDHLPVFYLISRAPSETTTS